MIPGRGSRLQGGGFPANGKRKVNILVSLELIIFTTDHSGIEKGIIIRIVALISLPAFPCITKRQDKTQKRLQKNLESLNFVVNISFLRFTCFTLNLTVKFLSRFNLQLPVDSFETLKQRHRN